MPRRGPAPTPPSLAILRGNPSKRPVRAEVAVPPGMPAPLVELSEAARACWDAVVPLAAEVGLATKLDEGVLTLFCATWSNWCELDRVLKRDGIVLANGSPHPLLKAAGDLAGHLRLLAAEIGATPSSRSRIRTPPPQPPSALDRFRQRHGH